MAYALNILLLGVLSIISYHLTRKRIKAQASRKHGCQPPRSYPHLDSFFGLDLKLQEIRRAARCASIPFTAQLFKKYGKTIEVNNFGVTTIRTIEPQNIRSAYATDNSVWGYEPIRYPVMGPFCGQGFITTDGATWKRSRALLRPTFSKANISEMSAFHASVEQFLRQLPSTGSTVDLQPLLGNLFLNTSTYFLLGTSFGALASKDAGEISDHGKAFLQAFHASMIGMGLSFLIGPFKVLIPKSLKAEAWQKTWQYVDASIDKALTEQKQEHPDERKSSASGGRSLLQGLAEQTDDRLDIRNQVLQGMLAAQDTTSILLSNTIFLLSRSPKIYERLRQEVLALGPAPVSFDTLGQMKLLGNILKESLRLYPVFPIMVRAAKNETTLPKGGGPNGELPVYIAPGTRIISNFYALHRDKSVFGPEVEVFDPDRWDSISPSPWEYMPFSGGPRACVGQHKALAEASYTIVRIAQAFKGLESRDAMDWAGQMKLTARNANGCKVALIPA